jgi:ABC-type transporter Mla MlaB component
MEAVAVPARIDVQNAGEVLELLREATQANGSMAPALDLAPLKDFDSSALSLLLQLARDRSAALGSDAAGGSRIAEVPNAASSANAAHTADAANADHTAHAASTLPGAGSQEAALRLSLLNPPRKLRALAELYGVEEMLFGASESSGQAMSF